MEEENKTTKKVHLALDGDDSLDRIFRVLNSIKSGGVGAPNDIQCLVETRGYGTFRIKDIHFDNVDRSVRFRINVEQPVEEADYRPSTNLERMLYPQKHHQKKQT